MLPLGELLVQTPEHLLKKKRHGFRRNKDGGWGRGGRKPKQLLTGKEKKKENNFLKQEREMSMGSILSDALF